jgi:hypothetical protein
MEKVVAALRDTMLRACTGKPKELGRVVRDAFIAMTNPNSAYWSVTMTLAMCANQIGLRITIDTKRAVELACLTAPYKILTGIKDIARIAGPCVRTLQGALTRLDAQDIVRLCSLLSCVYKQNVAVAEAMISNLDAHEELDDGIFHITVMTHLHSSIAKTAVNLMRSKRYLTYNKCFEHAVLRAIFWNGPDHREYLLDWIARWRARKLAMVRALRGALQRWSGWTSAAHAKSLLRIENDEAVAKARRSASKANRRTRRAEARREAAAPRQWSMALRLVFDNEGRLCAVPEVELLGSNTLGTQTTMESEGEREREKMAAFLRERWVRAVARQACGEEKKEWD